MKKRKQFTLIELIIIIVVIGILAGMALPKFFDIQRKAKYAKLLNNIDTVEKSIAIADTRGEVLPLYGDKVDFYSLNRVVQEEMLNKGESGQNIYKVKTTKENVQLNNSLIKMAFAINENLSDDEIPVSNVNHTQLTYGVGKYGINDYFLYSIETGNVYYANGNLIESRDSEITPITTNGTFYMTVNAGEQATWINYYDEKFIPSGGSIEYEWATTNDYNDIKDNSKLTWTKDFTSLPKSQYLKTKITIKSPADGEQTKLLKYRVQYLLDGKKYDEETIPNGNNNKEDSKTTTTTTTVTLPSDSKIDSSNTSSTIVNGGLITGSTITNNGITNTTTSSGGSSFVIGSGGSGGSGNSGNSGNSDNTITIIYPSDKTQPNKVDIPKDIEWKDIGEMTFECDAMQIVTWTGFEYLGYFPANTRLVAYFSYSDDNTNWTSESTSIGGKSQIVKARVILQKNNLAIENPRLDEVFFTNDVTGRHKGTNTSSNTSNNTPTNPNTPSPPNNTIDTFSKNVSTGGLMLKEIKSLETSDGGYLSYGYNYLSTNKGIITKYNKDLNNIEWQKFITKSKNVTVNSVVETNTNNYLAIAGNSLYKFSNDGTQVYEKSLVGDNFFKIIKTKDNSYILLSRNTILKIDENGTELSKKTFSNNILLDGYDIEELDDGYVVVGNAYKFDTFYFSILKLDKEFNLISNNNLLKGDSYAYLYGVDKLDDGSFVACGQTYKSAKLIKFSADLKTVDFDKSFGSYNGLPNNSFEDLKVLDNGQILVVGNLYESSYSGSSKFTDCFIGYFDTSGNLLDTKIYGTPYLESFHAINETKDGGYIIGSEYNSNESLFVKLNEKGLLN